MTDSPQPRWLQEEEADTWSSLVRMVLRLPLELDRQLRQDAGMSHYDYQVLARLSEIESRTMRMSELALLTEGSLPRLSQVVSKLEKRGWVARKSDPTNGRYTLATLTDEGYAVLEENAPGHVETVRKLVFDPLTPEQIPQMAAICRRIADAVDQAQERP